MRRWRVAVREMGVVGPLCELAHADERALTSGAEQNGHRSASQRVRIPVDASSFATWSAALAPLHLGGGEQVAEPRPSTAQRALRAALVVRSFARLQGLGEVALKNAPIGVMRQFIAQHGLSDGTA